MYHDKLNYYETSFILCISANDILFSLAVRNMSGGGKRIFHITPSRFQYTKFKDDLHFYITLGVVPLGLLILYCNIFIGPATLTEIPEGYEPKNYEYYKVIFFFYLTKI